MSAIETDRPFLGVASSALGQVWRDRLDARTRNVAIAISQETGLPELIGRVLAGRGVAAAEASGFLSPAIRELMPDPSVLTGMEAAAGRIAQAERLQLGQQVVPNLPVLTLVRDGSTYVEANFKETDLADMAVGQRAEVRFDAYPDLVLKGRVGSIGAGTGAEFAVLPAQNATGNWVKVTQRVPVRIAIEGTSPRRLIAGLSSDVTVFTDTRGKR